MKVNINRPVEVTVPASTMEIGQIGIVQGDGNSAYAGAVLLRSYDSFINLKDPTHTWSSHGMSLPVRILHPGTTVSLVTE